MYEKGFLKRIRKLGVKRIILSWDTLIGLITFFVLYILTGGAINSESGIPLLSTLTMASASLFGIILAGLAIVTSFTDKDFVYAWKKLDEFDNMITIFQYNLFLPLIIILLSLALQIIVYNGLLMIALVSIFVYMIVSLVDLVNFVCVYGLQRGEFIKQQIDERE
jgi:hypothetical protein